MGDIVNLRGVRKRKARAAAEQAASANRAVFGRSKAERKLTAAEKALEKRGIDGHLIEARELEERGE